MAKPTTAQKPAPATLTSVPTPAPAPAKRGPGRPPGAKAKAPKKGKPTQWAKWGKQAERLASINRSLSAIALTLPDVGKWILSDESIEEIGALVTALQKLDANRVEVPSIPKAPKGPVFAVGDDVKVAKKFRAKYLESGIYTDAHLDEMDVQIVGTKGLLCNVVDTELAVFVRYAKHLEKR